MIPRPATISALIPTLNETRDLPETIRHARASPEIIEYVVVDGGSTDGTRELAASFGCRVLAARPGRGGQLRLGAGEARGDVVLLLHADTWLPPGAGRRILECLADESVVGGGFWKVFRGASWMMRGSRLRCALRLWLAGRILGDQAIFVRRAVLEKVGGVPEMDLMEEFELCRRLRGVGQLALADATVTASARRFEKRGVLRTYLLMGWVTLRYYCGTSPARLRQIYERK